MAVIGDGLSAAREENASVRPMRAAATGRDILRNGFMLFDARVPGVRDVSHARRGLV